MTSLGIVYQLQQQDLSQAEMNDPLWEDQIKELPSGDLLLLREIKKALDGKPYKAFPGVEEEMKDFPAVTPEAAIHYFSVFHYSEEFGLPNGKGWIHELPWTLPFLNHMKYIKRKIEIDAERRALKGSGDSSGINPKKFEG